MDTQLLQRTREVLKNRVSFACACPPTIFEIACAQLLQWLEQQPLLRPELEILDAVARERGFTAIVAEAAAMDYGDYPIVTRSWEEHAALSLAALRRVSVYDISENNFNGIAYALSGDRTHQRAGVVANLRASMLASLIVFFDEALEGRFAVLALLKKYKQRSEWYRRHRLRAIAGDRFEGQRAGEDSLMMDLYEYVHDQGVNFRIESWSTSGRADLVSDVTEGTRLVLDGKYVRARHGRSSVVRVLAQGIRQVSDYCRDHNESAGYLVTFVNQDLDIQIAGTAGSVPIVTVGSTTVSCVFINIYEHPHTASERPSASIITIDSDELLRAADEADLSTAIVEDSSP